MLRQVQNTAITLRREADVKKRIKEAKQRWVPGCPRVLYDHVLLCGWLIKELEDSLPTLLGCLLSHMVPLRKPLMLWFLTQFPPEPGLGRQNQHLEWNTSLSSQVLSHLPSPLPPLASALSPPSLSFPSSFPFYFFFSLKGWIKCLSYTTCENIERVRNTIVNFLINYINLYNLYIKLYVYKF